MANDAFTGVDFVRDLSNPAKTHLWYLYFEKIPYTNADGENVKFNIHTTSIPSVQTDVIQVPWQGQVAVYPGRRTFSHTLSCTFMEQEDGIIGKLLYIWAQTCGRNVDGTMLSHGNNQGGAPNSGYKADAILVHLNENRQPINNYKLHNCWLANIGEVPLNQNSAGLVMYSCTFQYDWWDLLTESGVELLGSDTFDNFKGIYATKPNGL